MGIDPFFEFPLGYPVRAGYMEIMCIACGGVYRLERNLGADQQPLQFAKLFQNIREMSAYRESQKAHRKPRVNTSWLNVLTVGRPKNSG